MNCDAVREMLPDHVLGPLSEVDGAAVRRHLRGCAICRGEAERLDEGVALFASAAHATDPPPDLEERVMRVLAEEWREAPPAPVHRVRSGRWLLAVAAVTVALAGAVAWGATAQGNADRFRADAGSYQRFLHALGGRDVRVGTLRPARGSSLEGSAIMYDSDRGQSWILVLVRSPGTAGKVDVEISSAAGKTVPLHAIQLDPDGEGSTWLVTSADISALNTVRITDAVGHLLASGTAADRDPS